MIDLKSLIREIPDFPKKGVLFRDITTLLKDRQAFQRVIRKLAGFYEDEGVDKVVAVESRGFILGAPLAYHLGAGFVPIRKPGKLPSDIFEVTYELEYGSDGLAVHQDAIAKGERILLVDDLLATGGTMEAAVNLVRRFEGVILGLVFLVELTELRGRDKLRGYPILSLVTY